MRRGGTCSNFVFSSSSSDEDELLEDSPPILNARRIDRGSEKECRRSILALELLERGEVWSRVLGEGESICVRSDSFGRRVDSADLSVEYEGVGGKQEER